MFGRNIFHQKTFRPNIFSVEHVFGQSKHLWKKQIGRNNFRFKQVSAQLFCGRKCFRSQNVSAAKFFGQNFLWPKFITAQFFSTKNVSAERFFGQKNTRPEFFPLKKNSLSVSPKVEAKGGVWGERELVFCALEPSRSSRESASGRPQQRDVFFKVKVVSYFDFGHFLEK